MSSCKNSDFTVYISDFIRFSAVRSFIFIKNCLSEYFIFNFFKYFGNFTFIFIRYFFFKIFLSFTLNLCFSIVPFDFTGKKTCFFIRFINMIPDFVFKSKDFFLFDNRKFFFTGNCSKFFLSFTNILNYRFGFFNCLKHKFFRYFFTAAFNHCNSVFCTCYNDFHFTVFNLLECRVNNKRIINKAYSYRTNRSIERNI